jgi:hypothetical protein
VAVRGVSRTGIVVFTGMAHYIQVLGVEMSWEDDWT